VHTFTNIKDQLKIKKTKMTNIVQMLNLKDPIIHLTYIFL